MNTPPSSPIRNSKFEIRNFTAIFATSVSLVVSILLLSSCASVSVKNGIAGEDVPHQKPAVIYVADFAATGEFNVDRTGPELNEFKTGLQNMMTAALLERFNKHLGPAQYLAPGSRPPAGNAWVVYGTFTRVNQGSRALRAVVGFGAGGTKIETAVFVDNLADNSTVPFKAFDTTGGSGAMPGAVANTNPAGAAVSLAAGAIPGLSADVDRTSRMITAELSSYMSDRGWIAPDEALNPKRQN